MALASFSSSSYLTSSNFDESEVSAHISGSSQKKIKEEINQSLIDLCSSERIESNSQNEVNTGRLGMSSNIASKLNQLTLNTDNDLTEPNSETTSPEDVPLLPPDLNIPKKESGTRATPKQVFPNIACLPTENNIIFCFVLSVWDNLVGPQTVYVWKRKSKLKSYFLGNGNPNKEKEEKIHFSQKKINNGNTYRDRRPKRTNSIPSKNCTKDDDSVKYKRSLLRSNTVGGKEDLFNKRDASTLNDGLKNGMHPKARRLSLSTVVKYVTEHTVGVAESGRWKANKMVSFLLSVPHQDIIILSVRFHIIEDGVGVPYCLSAVIPSQDESLLIPVLNLTTETMYRIAAKIRLLITKEGLVGGDKIKGSLQEICLTLSSLSEASLKNYPLATLSRLPDDRRLAEKMLTSHLQTMGASLVIADSPSEANRVVMWLGQFLFEDDLSTSRIALSDGLWPYQPGISVQAVIRDSSGAIDLSSSKLLASRRPLTLIDLSSNSVRQMAPMNVHSKNSCATFRMELLALWHDLDHVPAPSQSLFECVEVASPMVKRFLHEWDRLPSCEPRVKKLYLDAFLRSIQYTALAVIMWTRHEWTKEKRRRDSKSVLQAICSTFLLEEPDLKVIIAQAERLEPGFLSSLLDKPVKD